MTPRTRVVDQELLGKAARLHYEFGLTHQEIGSILRLSRPKVTRLLQEAREVGIVKIRVDSEASPFEELETALVTRFGLDEVFIVPATEDDKALQTALALTAGRYLQRVLRDGMVVAVSPSLMVAAIPDLLVDPRPIDATFADMVGGIQGPDENNPFGSIGQFARAFRGAAAHLYAPIAVRSKQIARALFREPSIERTLGLAAGADVALVGIGGVREPMPRELAGEGDINVALDELLLVGAVGDIAARFFDEQGQAVQHDLHDRVIGLTLEQFRNIPLRVALEAGPGKEEAIGAAIRGGLLSVLITDAATAERLLVQERPAPGQGTAPVPAPGPSR